MQVMATLASMGDFLLLPVVDGHGQLTSYYVCRVFRKGHLPLLKSSEMMAACSLHDAEAPATQGRKQARFQQ